MSTIWGSEIITDGLVLALDAGNPRSYPGSGTTWYDLSIFNNSATMYNNPTYNSSNFGTLTFDGTNDYVDFYTPSLTSVATVEIWMKLGSSYLGKMPFGWNTYDVWCNNGAIGYNTFNSDVYGISQLQVTTLNLPNNWHHYVFEMRSDVSYKFNKIYIDTSIQTLSQVTGAENTLQRNFNSGNGRISSSRNGTSYLIPMEISLFKIYNRILTQKEILQNYNSTKNRFNL